MHHNAKFLLNIFSAFFIFLIYCEYVIYYVVIRDCYWPTLDVQNEDSTIRRTEVEPVRIMVIADIHLLGPRKGHWFDKLRREWQMYRAFQTSVHTLQPELVFVLGDIMDEGFYCSLEEFDKYVHRFKQLFAVPENTKLYTVVGNHDIGFHYEIRSFRNQMFIAAFNSTPVQFISLRGNYFVLVNSMALEGDGCTLCRSVELQLSEIESKLKCSKNSTSINCKSKPNLEFYSKPILMQHYPLYRSSDKECDDFDSAPMPIKEEVFRETWECLSKESTYQILNQIKPRLALSGHTHHGCTRKLPFGFGKEITIPSFNWRNKNNPTIGLGVITPNNFAFIKCSLPQESTVITIYISGITAVLCWILYSLIITR
ncbi:hypothetical protein WA026_006633 [Henosepilachna vigintioctopunctata]|uniref:Calcineurin-like phosphoesterase domain-containing protein n=1 Tax=Henosepilachna vigintioctopunctata TaxID=420089 RepID=A0AAW1UFU8_9CUCU